MPRENRKRGKKNKKTKEEPPELQPEPQIEPEVGPSWIVTASRTEDFNAEAPFGYVDADVKAYFRTVDGQICDWQENEETQHNDDNVDPNAEKQMFFVAALTEMTGREKQLATDPDCSIILERMAYSMDDFVRRVFLDSLSGSYEVLVKHRFASHACQTLLTVAADTITREVKNIFPSIPESPNGELRTMSRLVLDICEELLPSFSSLLMDPFASHVIRTLLGLLCPTPSFEINEGSQTTLRSKKSAKWKSRQGPLKSVFADSKGKEKEGSGRLTPSEFRVTARTLVETVRKQLGDNEVRALAADKVACPCLMVLLDVEAELNMANEPKSLMDKISCGAVSASLQEDTSIEPSDYFGTLFRDPTSSHLLEVILNRAPEVTFSLLWNAYIEGKLARLAVHPVANFVVAKAIDRIDAVQLEDAYSELQGSWEKMINSSRTGVLRAMIDRSRVLHFSEQNAIEAVYLAFNLTTLEDRKLLVPCVLSLQTLQKFKSREATAERSNAAENGVYDRQSHTNVQGSILLQTLLNLSESHNMPVIESLNSLEIKERLAIAHDATSSRVFDALIDSPTVPAKAKRSFILSFIGNFHLLVDDRIGSRVTDRLFAFADTYLKEKIGRSLIPHEQFLAGSHYGRFFSRNLNLYLLQRRPDEWKELHSKKSVVKEGVRSPPSTNSALESAGQSDAPKKRKRMAIKDEIDEVFATASTKKAKGPTGLPKQSAEKSDRSKALVPDPSLTDVMKAIRTAPKDRKKGTGRAGKDVH